jgi:hypothetical protein
MRPHASQTRALTGGVITRVTPRSVVAVVANALPARCRSGRHPPDSSQCRLAACRSIQSGGSVVQPSRSGQVSDAPERSLVAGQRRSGKLVLAEGWPTAPFSPLGLSSNSQSYVALTRTDAGRSVNDHSYSGRLTSEIGVASSLRSGVTHGASALSVARNQQPFGLGRWH